MFDTPSPVRDPSPIRDRTAVRRLAATASFGARACCVAVLAAVMTLARPLAASAEPRHAAIIVDANSGAVLHEQAADELRHPASLTKMMTLYMTFELIELGRLSYTTKIKVTQEAAAAAPTKLDLEPGEQIALIDAMKALVTKSANDMAIAIAQAIGGSEANFARLMTEKAHALGMKSTVFRNASGLPDDEQVTTARDMVTLALRLQDDFPKHYYLFGLRSFTYNGETYRNHNTLLNSYRGTDGIKTGYTHASGFNLVASVKRDGRHLIGAIFGGETAAARNAHLRVLLDRAFLRAATEKTRKVRPTAPPLVAKAKPAREPAKPVTVARNGPAPEHIPAPQPAVRPPAAPRPAEPQPAASAAPPAPAATEDAMAALVAATTTTGEDAAPTPAPTGTEALPAGIEIARVRRIMVAPRVKPTITTDSESPDPRLNERAGAAVPAPPAAAPARLAETIVPKAERASARPPSSFQDQVAALAANIAPSAPAAAGQTSFSSPTSPAPAAPQPPGLPPSTLAALAAAIDAAPDTPPAAASLPASYRLAGPDPNATPTAPSSPSSRAPVKGAFQIQIGAYGSLAEAERQVAAVAAGAAPVVAGHAPLTVPVAKGNRHLYRARFADFDANAAANACVELRRRQIDCFVMRAD